MTEKCCFCGKEIMGTKYPGFTLTPMTSDGQIIYIETYSCWDCMFGEEKSTFEPPIKKTLGLFRNLGKKITQAMRENEERDEQHIWNELKENEFKSMYILPPYLFSSGEIKDPPLQWDFRIPEKEEEK